MRKVSLISSLSEESEAVEYQKNLINNIKESAINLKLFDLGKLNIKSCSGCWGCWVKTPGKCVINDDMGIILKGMINSDLVLFLSNPVLGYVDGNMKIAMDRTIPLVHPYIEIVEKECHHHKRYKKYPQFGVILYSAASIEPEDKEIIKSLFNRYALNFRSNLRIFKDSTENIDEVVNEINSI